MQNTKQKLIAIVGPTATGKSDLAVKIAQRHRGEVISADSRQVYVGLDIGSGKITKREMKGVPHHLLDVVSPKKRFSVSDYVKHASKALADIEKREKLPIIAGGTGLYVDGFLNGIVFPEVPPNSLLRKKLERKTLKELARMLKAKDPVRFKSIDTNNKVRLIRALEIISALGKVPKQSTKPLERDILWIGLTDSPTELRKRIERRLLVRLKKGMEREVGALKKSGVSWKRFDALGLEYRYIARYLQGKISKKEMVAELLKESIAYSKRQMTWFKRNQKIQWFKPGETKKIEKLTQSFLAR
ncbi:MAG: tRNA (adenosine(37)-N6)-dimethylallyltransferase MiaA [Candidatus Pacebacteria bacterium]|nr:tRNA (adenosine(37)-N6)-dimethylallyltransferase MiaA [Candidatus Paceibacterota bacterium]